MWNAIPISLCFWDFCILFLQWKSLGRNRRVFVDGRGEELDNQWERVRFLAYVLLQFLRSWGLFVFLLFLYIGELLSSFLNFFMFVWFLLFYSVLWIPYPLFCYVKLLLLMNYVSYRTKEKREIIIANYKTLLFSDVYPNLLFLLTFIVELAIYTITFL